MMAYMEQAVSYARSMAELAAAGGAPVSEVADQSYGLHPQTGQPGYESALSQQGVHELEAIRTLVRACGYGPDRIRIDPGIVRGLEYYTGPVFELELALKAGRVKQPGLVRSAAAGGMTALWRASAASPSPPLGFPSGYRGCLPRSSTPAKLLDCLPRVP